MLLKDNSGTGRLSRNGHTRRPPRRAYRFAAVLTILFLATACRARQERDGLESLSAAAATPPTDSTMATPDTAARPSQRETTPAGSEASGGRAALTFKDLMEGFNASSPLPEDALAPPAGADPPGHLFEGRLELHGEAAGGQMRLVTGEVDESQGFGHLPEIDLAFVQHEGYLVPVLRGVQLTEHPVWNMLVEPGRIWQEPSDQGYTRASFPFALMPRGGSSTFNGVMSFVFDDKSVSRVWYQVTQDTTIFASMELWGLLEATYHPGPVAEAAAVRAAFADELSYRFPTKPIAQLAADYPGADPSRFGADLSPQHTTWYGFVIDGVNYVGGCQTRYGVYAYCESMRAPSFSTAKSAFVSVALMRLAQVYGNDVSRLLIADYVPETAASPGDWSSVTFDHTLDMATGNYLSAGFMVDEEHFDSDPFWAEEYEAGKIAAALDWPNSNRPGVQWVYRTSDTFILTRALANYLRDQIGPDADIFQYVVDEVYRPIHIAPGAYSTLRARDNDWQGQPLGGYGLWWIPDDLAKIATLLNVAGGSLQGRQLLHPALLDAALQRDPADRGVPIDANRRYNNAFWAQLYTKEDGFDCDFWVPHMLGYSGIVVALFPNGTAYYYANDAREFTWDEALAEAGRIAPLCGDQARTTSTHLSVMLYYPNNREGRS